MRLLIIIATVLLITSCDSGQKEKDLLEYKDGRQLLTLNNLKRNGDKLDPIEVGIIAPDTIVVGEQFLAKIFLKNKDYKIAAAYYNCKAVDNPSIDTSMYLHLSGCKMRLEVRDDTIFMAFRPQVIGTHTVDPLTILTEDKEKIYRTVLFSYSHTEVEK